MIKQLIAATYWKVYLNLVQKKREKRGGIMMIRITLICAGGMSTSMLVAKMIEAAKDKDLEIEINAIAEGKFKKEYSMKTDILLLGPQVGYMLDSFKKEYEPKGMKIDVIDSIDYGMMNGGKVLTKALNI